MIDKHLYFPFRPVLWLTAEDILNNLISALGHALLKRVWTGRHGQRRLSLVESNLHSIQLLSGIRRARYSARRFLLLERNSHLALFAS